MTNKSLNISGRLDSISIDRYRIVHQESEKLKIEYLVVGAAARDLILHHAYGVEIRRGTTDTDFAIEISSWDSFQNLKKALFTRGFKETALQHRIESSDGAKIDIVPFGAIATQNGQIEWPPNQDTKMSVLGFSEAFAHRKIVQITDQPSLDIPVVSLAGLILLKLIAWADRPRDLRPKDAEDIKYVIKSNVKIDPEVSRIWDAVDLLEKYQGDIDLVSANILGGKVGGITNNFSRAFITSTFDGHTESLAVDMGPTTGELDENLALISAFFEGFGAVRP